MNGFGFDSAAQFFGESAFDDGFSNTDSNGFGSSFFTESVGYTDGMFCEGTNSDDSDKKGDYIDKHKGENAVGCDEEFTRAAVKRAEATSFGHNITNVKKKRSDEASDEIDRHNKKFYSAYRHHLFGENGAANKKK